MQPGAPSAPSQPCTLTQAVAAPGPFLYSLCFSRVLCSCLSLAQKPFCPFFLPFDSYDHKGQAPFCRTAHILLSPSMPSRSALRHSLMSPFVRPIPQGSLGLFRPLQPELYFRATFKLDFRKTPLGFNQRRSGMPPSSIDLGQARGKERS